MADSKSSKNATVKKVLDKIQRTVVGPKPADPDKELRDLTERGDNR